MMRPQLCAAVLVAVLALIPATQAFHPPWFCHDLDCPEYDVLDRFDDVQLRAYNESKWASTIVTGDDYDAAIRTGFWRLFKYISGKNEPAAKIPMTAPVKVRINPGAGPFCEDNFTISFYVPPDFQEDTPEPTEDTVYVEIMPPTKMYVYEYPGFAPKKQVLSQASRLVQVLDDNNQTYSLDYYYSSGYDSPFRLIHRHNEIWIPAADEPEPSPAQKAQKARLSWSKQV